MQSVTEQWVYLYSLLQKYGYNHTVCYRNMCAIIQSGIELWGEVYRLLQNYEYKNTVWYGMGASLRSCYRITVVYLKILQNYGFEFKRVF